MDIAQKSLDYLTVCMLHKSRTPGKELLTASTLGGNYSKPVIETRNPISFPLPWQRSSYKNGNGIKLARNKLCKKLGRLRETKGNGGGKERQVMEYDRTRKTVGGLGEERKKENKAATRDYRLDGCPFFESQPQSQPITELRIIT
ncbi:hypothetical protein EAI_02854 [Harpegnathos saltator]|uniref:Uncharacterized protein n=1 Tax=Harpegnathos saltator TaxID=610380 RepID=E2C6R9_HARSA|nr:hypothetical protein EAI_02854 [Harpegnathos saltator]